MVKIQYTLSAIAKVINQSHFCQRTTEPRCK